jgi:hypothetical protein
MKRFTFEEMMNAATPRTFVSEAIDGVVDFVIVEAVVEETAEARARRRWHMDERKADDVH